MEKQELIEKLKEEKEKNHVRCVVANPASIEVNNTFYQVDKSLETAINYAEQLDEPQKVKVPAAIGNHIRKRKIDGDNFHESILATNSQIYEWYMENAELYEQAWLDGYEIEEEPKWKIINDQKYCLTSIEAGYGNSLHWAFDSTKKKPILFDNEETALYTAYITGGTVEKV
jgi:hypothetical protein